jgi:hypothetical protein
VCIVALKIGRRKRSISNRSPAIQCIGQSLEGVDLPKPGRNAVAAENRAVLLAKIVNFEWSR